VEIILTDERSGSEKTRTFKFDGGVKSFVQYLNKEKPRSMMSRYGLKPSKTA
jgi:DNA gyrase/topoisomerase IV subunit B